VSALVLLVGLSASASVGTAFVFARVMRRIAAPLYLAGKHVHWRYLWLLIQGDTGRNSSAAGYTYLSPVRLVAVRTIGRKRELG
jgi:hypothetical protein